MPATAAKVHQQRERAKLELYRMKGIEVYTSHHTEVEGNNCSITVDVDPNDSKPGRVRVSMGSFGLAFTSESVEGQRPAVEFDCERSLLKALADAFAEAYAASSAES